MIFPTLQNPVLKISFIIFLLCRNTPPLSAQTVVHSNELGIHFGNFVIDGDVDHPLFPGWGLGLHYRTSLNQVFSFRTTFSYGITHGLNANPTGDGILNEPEVFRDYSIDQPWFYAFQSRLIRLNVQGIMEITNLGYSKKYNDF